MNQRLQQFLLAENISQAQFADTIGVARGSISHILAGRNRPSYDFIEKTMAHFPKVNIEWLMTGAGKMYKNTSEAPAAETAVSIDTGDLFAPAPVLPADSPAQISEIPSPSVENVQICNSQRHIEKIVVFYSDNTYAEIK